MGPIEYDVQPERIGNAEAVRYIDEKIEHLRNLVANRPRPPTNNNLMEIAVRRWVAKVEIFYGKVLGNIEAMANFGHITQEYAKQLENGLKGLINYHVGIMIMGK